MFYIINRHSVPTLHLHSFKICLTTYFRQPYFQVVQQRLNQDAGEIAYGKIGQQKRQPVQLMKSQISLLQPNNKNNNKQIKSVTTNNLQYT